MNFRLRALYFAVSLFLVGCADLHPKGELQNPAQSSGPPTAKQMSLWPHERLITTYQIIANVELTNVSKLIYLAKGQRVPDLAITVDDQLTGNFSFYTLPKTADQKAKIVMGVESLTAVHNLAEAQVVAFEVLGDPDWWVKYLALARKTGSIPNVEDLLGWDFAQGHPELQDRAIGVFYGMLMFLVAHEIGHSILNHRDYSFATDPASLELSRLQESAADQFALDLFDSPKGALPDANCLLSSWVLIVQGGPNARKGTHPAEYTRLLAAMAHSESLDASHLTEDQREKRRKLFEHLKRTKGILAQPGTAAWFNEFVDSVQEKDLKRKRPKKLHGSEFLKQWAEQFESRPEP